MTGLGHASPITFACYGSYLAKLGMINGAGRRFIFLSESLLDKLFDVESAGQVIGITSEVRCFIEPAQAANELRIQGESRAVSVGDIQWACLNRMRYCAGM